MFIPEFMTAGYLLAIRHNSRANANTHKRKLFVVVVVVVADTTRFMLHNMGRLGAHDGDGEDARVLYADESGPASILPNPLLRPAAHGPGMPAVHQGIKHNGPLRDGLLSDDKYRVPRVNPNHQ
ncbi:hypothetical protein CHU98_g10655 [Xylaria longipes]|nr:hypothetical protein CHU98_g10655 [Xylaria longipes]